MRNLTQQQTDWATKDLYVTFRKPMETDHDLNMKAIPRKQRAMVRKGVEAGLTSDLDDGVERLYRIYAESVRNLGTPVFTKYLPQNAPRCIRATTATCRSFATEARTSQVY